MNRPRMLREPNPAAPKLSRPYFRVAWLLDAGWIALLSGWIVVAVVAAFHPAGLTAVVASFIPIRRDTFGIVCFAASAVWFLAAAFWRGRTHPLLRVLRVFGGATVLYLSVNLFSHPRTMGMPLTHFAPWPSELATLILVAGGFILSHITLTRKG
jgi:hypothetical protein